MAMFKNLSGISSREREFKIPLRGCFNEAMLWGKREESIQSKVWQGYPIELFLTGKWESTL